jgi:multiple sugar transport system substrate-binding protein
VIAMQREAVSRRRFLIGLVGVAGVTGAALATACGQPAAAPAAKPTEAAKPAAPVAAQPTEAPKPAEAAKPGAEAKPTEPPKPQIAPVSGRPITLSYWFWADDADQAKIITDAIDRFHQKQNRIQVQPDQLPTVADTQKKVLSSAAVGQAPDTSHGSDGWLQDMYDGEVVLPVQDYFDKWERKDDVFPNVVELSKVKPSQPILFVPNHVIVNYLYVRLDWLKEANLNPPDTFEEMLAAAKAMAKPPDRYGFGLRAGDVQGVGMLAHWWLGNGVKIVDEKDDVDFDSPVAIETTEQYAAMYTKDKSAQPSAPSDRFPQLFAQFQGGKLAMLQHGLHSWKVQNDALGDKITAVAIPRGKVSRFTGISIEGTLIYKGTKNPEAAWEFASFMGDQEQARDFVVKRGAGPTLKSIANDPIFTENRFYKAAMDAQPSWGSLPAWHRNYLKFRDTFVPLFQQVLKEEITAKKMHEDLAKILREK